MDFTYDDEQNALRDAVRGLLTKAYGDFEQRRQTTKADPGFSEKTWTQMAEMGLLGLPFSEDDGGVGAGPVEIAIVCQELGRVVAPEPYVTAVVLAGGLVQASAADPGTRAWQVDQPLSTQALESGTSPLHVVLLVLQGVTLVVVLVLCAPTRERRRRR